MKIVFMVSASRHGLVRFQLRFICIHWKQNYRIDCLKLRLHAAAAKKEKRFFHRERSEWNAIEWKSFDCRSFSANDLADGANMSHLVCDCLRLNSVDERWMTVIIWLENHFIVPAVSFWLDCFSYAERHTDDSNCPSLSLVVCWKRFSSMVGRKDDEFCWIIFFLLNQQKDKSFVRFNKTLMESVRLQIERNCQRFDQTICLLDKHRSTHPLTCLILGESLWVAFVATLCLANTPQMNALMALELSIPSQCLSPEPSSKASNFPISQALSVLRACFRVVVIASFFSLSFSFYRVLAMQRPNEIHNAFLKRLIISFQIYRFLKYFSWITVLLLTIQLFNGKCVIQWFFVCFSCVSFYLFCHLWPSSVWNICRRKHGVFNWIRSSANRRKIM